MTIRTPRRSPGLPRGLGWTLALLICGGCGGGGGPSPDAGADAGLVLPEGEAFRAQGSSCVIDAECRDGHFCFQRQCVWECKSNEDCGTGERCSASRRCERSATKSLGSGDLKALDTGQTAALPDVIEGVGLANAVPLRHAIEPGQGELELVLETTSEVPGGAIGYALETYDEATRTRERDERLYRATGETRFTLRIPTGSANPSEDPSGSRLVTVHTAVGQLQLILEPRHPQAGAYQGTVRLDQIGRAEVPLAFEVLTSPVGADLESADSAQLLLPVRPDALFSPHAPAEDASPGEEPHVVAAPLHYDAFVEGWVATFDHTFELPEDAALSGYGPGQVQRTLRFELSPQGELFIGRMSDRWSGLYDKRSALDVVQAADVVFEGDFELRRMGNARQADAIPDPVELPEPDPQLLPLPSLAGCDDGMLAASADVGEVTYGCETFESLQAFEDSADLEQNIACAIAVTEQALAADTTSTGLIQAHLRGEGPEGESFSDFIDRCAAGTDGTCVPSDEVLCGRDLLAWSYQQLTSTSDQTAQLLTSYQHATQEAFLGRRLAAFKSDADARLAWLRAQNYPAVVTSAVRDLNAELLADWKDRVLEVHLDVLGAQFDASALSVLSRSSDDARVIDARAQVLLDMSQSWRGAAQAVALAAERWNDLFQDLPNRDRSARYVRTKMLDLYLMAGILYNLNRDSGTGFGSGPFAGGFAAIHNQLSQLSLPFSSLVFARDTEVVVSRSLDPSEDEDTLLSGLQEAALSGLEAAEQSVTSVLDDLQADQVDEATLRGRLADQIRDLRSELIDLCGLPLGCTADEASEARCRPRVQPGTCGLGLTEPGLRELQGASVATFEETFRGFELGASQAGDALLAIAEAKVEVQIADEDLLGHQDATQRFEDLTDGFKTKVTELDQTTLEDGLAAALMQLEGQSVAALDDLVTRISDKNMEMTRLAGELRSKWGRLSDSTASEFGLAKDSTIEDLQDAAEFEQSRIALQGVSDTFEDVATPLYAWAGSISAHSVPLLVAGSVATGASALFQITANVAESQRVRNAGQAERNEIERQFVIDQAQANLDYDLGNLEGDVSDAEAELRREQAALGLSTAQVETTISNLRFQIEQGAARARDLQELADRQYELANMVDRTDALALQTDRARLTLAQKVVAYDRIVQQAQLLDSRLAALEEQQSALSQLLGSPDVVFGWANRLEQAESRLSRAKDAMMEWLVALEYFAVRPFMDQRVQILLARNTYQLEEIAAELSRLQRNCGGAVSKESVKLSLVQLLGLTRGLIDPETGEPTTADERLRAMLSRGVVPVDKRLRYTTESNVGDLISSRDVWALTFDLSLTDFANLAASCNAKVASLSLELVGDALGQARPTVSVLYDGASAARSCQPNIAALVSSIGADATTFGPITTFRAAGRSVSPVAGIGEPGEPNASLRGLPLASQYTVLIDRDLGENADVAWDQLEDIRIHLEYAYQDLFPEGQCQ